MTEPLKNYMDVVLTQRDWSWAIIGIAYLIIALSIRSWFTSPLVRRVKDLDKKQAREIKKIYLENSIFGWFFFIIPFFIITWLWYNQLHLPMSVQEALILLGAFASFVLSIIAHIIAFGLAAMSVLKKFTDSNK